MLLMLLVGVGSFVSAQGLSFGIKGGASTAKLAGTDIGSTSNKTGLTAGVFLTLNLVMLKLQPEILYSQKGAVYENSYYSATAKFDYLEIPVLTKYSFGAIIVPSIYIGPYFGIPLSAKIEKTQTIDAFPLYPPLKDTTYTDNVKKDMINPDLGLVLGAEIKTPFKLSFEVRYTRSLLKIFKEEAGIQPDIKNSIVSVMVGYTLF